MATIARALQDRLLDAAARHLGATGPHLLRSAGEQALGVPLEEVEYAGLPALLQATAERAGNAFGSEAATAIARDLRRLYAETNARFADRLVAALGVHIGAASAPLLASLCARLGVESTAVGPATATRLAALMRRETSGLFGGELAGRLADAIDREAQAPLPGLDREIATVAALHAGPDGPRLVEAICGRYLEVDLHTIAVAGLIPLADVIERHGPPVLGAALCRPFVRAAKQAIAGDNSALHTALLATVTRHVGPAGPLFLRRLCAAQGLPFEAVCDEHLPLLSMLAREQAAPLIGPRRAEELARQILGGAKA